MSKASIVDSTLTSPPEVLSEVTVLISEPVTVQTVVLELTVEEAAIVCALLGEDSRFCCTTGRVVAAMQSLPRIRDYSNRVVESMHNHNHGIPKELE
jgi:hypothetical protein